MVTHSSILAWKIPRTVEPEGLQSVGPQTITWLSNWARVDRERERESSFRIDSDDYVGQEISWSAICKLENQEIWGYSSVQAQGPNSRGANGIRPGQVRRPENQECRCPRIGENGCPTSGGRSKSPLPLPFCAIHAFGGLENSHSHQWGWIFFTHLINSNANLFQKHSHNRSEIIFYQLTGHSFAQSSQHITFTFKYNEE